MAIDFSLLHPTQGPAQPQIVQLPNYSAQNQQLMLQGAQAGSEMAARSAENARAQQLLPGQLQQQQLTNQGLGLQNQQKQMEMQGMQLQIKQRQDRMQAYSDAKAKGGTEAGLDAVQEKLMEQGDTTSGLEM